GDLLLDPHQLGSQLLELLRRFRDEGVQVLVGRVRHDVYSPSTFFTTASTSSPRKGLTMKSVAPASMASITSDSWPRAEHMITTAPGSCWTISRVASIPDLYGITMSMVTRSGLSSRKRLTACTPSSASQIGRAHV